MSTFKRNDRKLKCVIIGPTRYLFPRSMEPEMWSGQQQTDVNRKNQQVKFSPLTFQQLKANCLNTSKIDTKC